MSSALLGMTQAAAVIGVKRQAVHLAIQGGRLRAERYGRYLLITQAEAERYRERSHTDPDMMRRHPAYRIYPPKTNKKRIDTGEK